MSEIIQLLVYGIQLGSTYALLALGYSMVYGIVKMINMAHGDFLMVGALIAIFCTKLITAFSGIKSAFPLGLIALIAISSMLLTGILGVVTERIAYRPLRSKPSSCLISALGVDLFIQNILRVTPAVGPKPRKFPNLFGTAKFEIGNVSITNVQVIVILVAFVIMIGLHLLVEKTKSGRQMHAVSLDKDASCLMGINVDRTISLTFFIGASLAGIGGILYGSVYPLIDIYIGSWLGTKAFIAAILGGIGDLRGAMLGGILMGIIEIFAMSVNSDLGYGAVFVVLICVLLFKPAGLLGKPTVEKV